MLRFAVRTLALLLSTAPLSIAQSACECNCLKDACWSLLQGPGFFPSQSVVDDCRSFVYTTSYNPAPTVTETTFITSTATAESTSTETSFLPGPTMTTTVAAVTITSTVTAGGGAKLMVRDVGMEKVKRQARALPSYASGVCTDGPAFASACSCIVAVVTSQVILLDATTTVTAQATGTVTDVIINLNVAETTVTGTYIYVTSGTTTVTQTVSA
ncbi:hypothetical protein TWF694_003395 [Orbilia ellipsospora]|uniref:Uncharacterized protein n=1 Tax=Orbilia ellipsospora TaxID=2528407 RepID=A0AAV9WYY2_9PEZI